MIQALYDRVHDARRKIAKARVARWAWSPAGLGYQHALDDVWDYALDDSNPCHDEIREWIVRRRRQLAAGEEVP